MGYEYEYELDITSETDNVVYLPILYYICGTESRLSTYLKDLLCLASSHDRTNRYTYASS